MITINFSFTSRFGLLARRFHALPVNNAERGPLQRKQSVSEAREAQAKLAHINEKLCPQDHDKSSHQASVGREV
jgi:hypothetical protein